jgi:hypothetical protein
MSCCGAAAHQKPTNELAGIGGNMKALFGLATAFFLSIAGFAIVGNALAAELSSTEKLEIKVDPKKLDGATRVLWDRFGGFCQIAEWHPVVFSCTEGKDNGAMYRNLSLKDGGNKRETIEQRHDELPLCDRRKPLACKKLPSRILDDFGKRRSRSCLVGEVRTG